MHSHILPGIDDGAANEHESAFLINSLVGLGFSQFIATPHILSDLYPNTPETIAAAREKLNGVIDAPVKFAAEYMVDMEFDQKLADGDLLVFDDNYILIEMSYVAESPNIWSSIFDLKIKGFQPVLAHPERYNFYHGRNEAVYQRFKEAGCLLQMNILSLAGYYGRYAKNIATDLLRKKMYDFAGTDAHHQRHIAALTAFPQAELELLRGYEFRNSDLKF